MCAYIYIVQVSTFFLFFFNKVDANIHIFHSHSCLVVEKKKIARYWVVRGLGSHQPFLPLQFQICERPRKGRSVVFQV